MFDKCVAMEILETLRLSKLSSGILFFYCCITNQPKIKRLKTKQKIKYIFYFAYESAIWAGVSEINLFLLQTASAGKAWVGTREPFIYGLHGPLHSIVVMSMNKHPTKIWYLYDSFLDVAISLYFIGQVHCKSLSSRGGATGSTFNDGVLRF